MKEEKKWRYLYLSLLLFKNSDMKRKKNLNKNKEDFVENLNKFLLSILFVWNDDFFNVLFEFLTFLNT